jgi:hypothetical protein
MRAAPRLLAVPAFHNELLIKATATGITILKDGRFRKRYTGSRYSAVDINGKFWDKSSDLSKAIRIQDPVRTKKKSKILLDPAPPVVTGLIESSKDNQNEISTNKKRKGEYVVNKLEVRQRILGHINTMKGEKELYFWTVTFPPESFGMTDDLCYQVFNTWLTALRQKGMLKDYLWIAERQDGKRIQDPGREPTNTIHFHLAIPHKMHALTANKLMRGSLFTFAKDKVISYPISKLSRYNGVHIAKNRKTGRVVNFAIKKGSRALGNYLTKYVTKNNEKFKHLCWHNSRGYSAIFTGITFTIPEFIGYGFKGLLFKRAIIQNEFFSFYPWLQDPPEAITKHLYDVNSYLQERTEKSTK